jgi:hypothetical protein
VARVVAATATYSRYSLLEMQVRSLLREAAGADSAALAKVSRGLASPHYIESISVRGLYRQGTIGAQLHLTIDWREHAIALRAGGSSVQVPSTWSGSVAPTLIEAVRTFNDAVEQANLHPEWVVSYGRQWDVDHVNRQLGFVRASSRRWEREPERLELGFSILTEASLVVSLAI